LTTASVSTVRDRLEQVVSSVRQGLEKAVSRVRQRPRAAILSAVALAVPVLVFLVVNDRIMKAPLGYDEQFFFWGGWNITLGGRPYVDFFEFKPPMVFITHALAVAIAGPEDLHYRAVFSALALGSLTLLHLSLFTRGINRALSMAFITALTFQWVNPAYHDNALQDAESIGLVYYCSGVAALIAQTRKPSPVLEAIGAGLLALTALSKEPFTGAVIGTWATCFFLKYDTVDFRRNALSYLKRTTAGVGVAALGICLYMGPIGSLRRYIELVIEYAVLFRDPKMSYCVYLGRWTPGTPLQELRAQVDYIHKQFFNTATIGYLAPFFVSTFVFAWSGRKGSKVLLAVGFVTMLLSIYAVTATNCQWPHYYNMALPGIFLFFLIGLDRMKDRLAGADAVLRRGVCALFIGVLAVFMFPRIRDELAKFPYTWSDVSEPVPGAFAFIESNTQPSDRIFTTGPPGLYMFVNRLSAVRESSILDDFMLYFPGSTDEEKVRHIREQLVRNQPKVIIVDPENAHRKVRYMNALINPFLTEFGYKRVGNYFYMRPN
jgi:hypothetical protein